MSTSFTDVSTLHWVRLFAKSAAVSALRYIRLGVLLLSSALVACGQSADQPGTAEPAVVVSPNDDRAYDLIELANGMKSCWCRIRPRRNRRPLWHRFGRCVDLEDYPGMAHYLEHMLFMGPSSFPSPTGLWLYRGAWRHDQCSTGLDITNYMMMVENEAPAEALDRFSSFFTDPLLTPLISTRKRTR